MKLLPPTLTLTERVYERIKHSILLGELRPGQRVTESALASRSRTSKTPVRESIVRLARDGLLILLPHRGASVIRFSSEDVRSLYDLREALEALAMRLLPEVITNSGIAQLRTRVQSMDTLSRAGAGLAAHAFADVAFHSELIRLTRSRFPIETYQVIAERLLFLRMKQFSLPGRPDKGYRDHVKILAAISDRDADRSESLMRQHIEDAKRAVMESVERGTAVAPPAWRAVGNLAAPQAGNGMQTVRASGARGRKRDAV